jgi:hypothetical protein
MGMKHCVLGYCVLVDGLFDTDGEGCKASSSLNALEKKFFGLNYQGEFPGLGVSKDTISTVHGAQKSISSDSSIIQITQPRLHFWSSDEVLQT